MIDWHIGTIGFGYNDWLGPFYPPGTKPNHFLQRYAEHFDAIELDTTFHAIPPTERVRYWARVTPDRFRFSVKTPKTVTHESSLLGTAAVAGMRKFLDVARELGEKLAVVLLQFPPNFSIGNEGGLRAFLDLLPSHLRYAVEFRHPSWNDARTAAMLAERDICLVAAEYVGEPAPIERTTDFLYLRFIGEHHRFARMDHEQVDMTPRLRWWAKQIEGRQSQIQAVWAVFNNDYSGYAVGTADRFRRLLNLPVPTTPAGDAPTLFD